LRSFSGSGTWAKFWFRHKTGTDRNQVIQNRPKKGLDEYFSVPVLDNLVSVSDGLVPEPALCPGAGARAKECCLYQSLFLNEFILFILFKEKYLKNGLKWF
jgi:hypothetical protein